jgi:hypothetical protein
LTDPGAEQPRLGLPPLPVRLLLGGLLSAAILLVAYQASGIGTRPAAPPSPVVGVVVAIDQVSLTQVNSFDLRMSGGATVRLKVGILDNATEFSLSHLAAHMATGVPIRAFYRTENGEPFVYHLEDAVPASASPAAT